MPVYTAAIALLVSLGGLVFALLVFTENRRLQRETQRATALASTHMARLLVDEAAEVLRRADALLEAAGVTPAGDDAERYAAYRRAVADDRAELAKAMAALAFGAPALIECRALAARSTLIGQRTIAGRRVVLDLLTTLRVALAALPHGDGVAPGVTSPELEPAATGKPTATGRPARPPSRRKRRSS